MASINGISVKAMKTFKGHEGEDLCQGNLYLNGKKVGFWSQDAHGAICDNLTMDKDYCEERLREAVKKANADKAYMAGPEGSRVQLEYDFELLMGDYVNLTYEEKAFKDAVKKGYSCVLIATDGYHQVSWSLPKAFLSLSDDEVKAKLSSEVSKAANANFFQNEPVSLKIYRSLDDFNIGEPIALESIVYKPKLKDTIQSCEDMSKQVGAPSKNKENNLEL